MKVKHLGIALLASTFFYFTNPIIPLSAQKTVHASEEKHQTEIQRLLKEKKAKTLQELETVLKADYGLNIYQPDEDDYYSNRELPATSIELRRFYNEEECDLSSVLKVLQDEEFKEFYNYASEAYPYKWQKNLFTIVEAYKDLEGFEGVRSWLHNLNIKKKLEEDKELEYDTLLALTSSKGGVFGEKKFLTVYNFPWDIFKKHPKVLAELSAMSEFHFDYEKIPKDLIDDYSQELIEMAKYSDPYNIGFVFEEIPKKQLREDPKRIVEIARHAKNRTFSIYEFIKITQIVPDNQSIAEMTTQVKKGRYYSDKELNYNDIKRLHTRLNDKRLINSSEFFEKDEEYHISEYLYELGRALTFEYAKEKGLEGNSLEQLKSFLKRDKKTMPSLIGERPQLHYHKEFLEVNRESAEALIKVYQDNQVPEYSKENILSIVYYCTRGLADLVNLLHDNQAEREEAVSSLSPDITFFALAQGDEVFTSSFNLLYDHLAYRLGGGQGILTQDGRTEQQESMINIGQERVLDFIAQLDQKESELSRFIFRTSYFGRLHEIIPEDKQKQEAFFKKIIGYTKRRNRDSFYLAPTFESILSTEDGYKRTLENLLLEDYEQEKNVISGLVIYAYQNKLSETNKERVKKVVEELEKEYGINLGEMELPQEWFTKKEGDDVLTLRFKLYFHPETKTDTVLKPDHMRLMINQFIGWGYTQKTHKNSEVTLTKMKENSHGENVKLEFILSNKENLNIKEDMKSNKIILSGHRGHSYDVYETFSLNYEYYEDQKLPFTKLIFLGSCGGFNSVPYLNNDFDGQTQFIATKNIGQGVINNTILYELAETLAEKPKKWRNAYETIKHNIETKYENNSELQKEFRNYSFPGDLPSLVLKYCKKRY